MSKTGISEFTFGFAFLHEQANLKSSVLTAAPILPSLIQEQDEGWDAKLPIRGGAFFYQFKISDYLKRSNARFIKNGPYTSSYYCVSLHKNNQNQQHNKLKVLSETFPNTFYVAPEFTGINAFNSAYLSNNVSRKSRIIPLTGCHSYNDEEQHYLTYQIHNRTWRQHSKVRVNESSYNGEELIEFYMRSAEINENINFDYAIKLHNQISIAVYKSMDEAKFLLTDQQKSFLHLSASNKSIKTIFLHIGKIASVFFGATLVLAGKKS